MWLKTAVILQPLKPYTAQPLFFSSYKPKLHLSYPSQFKMPQCVCEREREKEIDHIKFNILSQPTVIPLFRSSLVSITHMTLNECANKITLKG